MEQETQFIPMNFGQGLSNGIQRNQLLQNQSKESSQDVETYIASPTKVQMRDPQMVGSLSAQTNEFCEKFKKLEIDHSDLEEKY